MRKILSLILAVAMFASFAMVASAATDVTYNIVVLDKAGNEITGELNPGDEFVIQIKGDTSVNTFGMWITLDDDAFEEANCVKYSYINEDEETVVEYKQMTCGTFTASVVNNPDSTADMISVGGFKTSNSKVTCKLGYKVAENAAGGTYPIAINKFVTNAMGSFNGIVGTSASITVAGGSTEPAEFDVTYAANDLVVWGNKPATTTDKVVKFEATPAFGYMITKVNGETVANTAGGEYEVTLTEATEIAVEVAAIDTKVIATKYVDGSKAYIFGKANFAASAYGVAVEINGAVVNDPANGVADGKYAATANANGAFGVAFDVTGKVFKGDWSVKAYADESESTAVTFAIN